MENQPTCPICNTLLTEKIQTEQRRSGDKHLIICPRCGKYIVPRSTLNYLSSISGDLENVVRLSYYVRKIQNEKEIPFLGSDLIKQLLEKPLPVLQDQINNTILWFGNNFHPGQYAEETEEILKTIMGAKTQEGVGFLLGHLVNSGLIVIPSPKVGLVVENGEEEEEEEEIPIRAFTLTFDGWDYYDKINRGLIMSRKAFMAMKFGEEDLDLIFQNHFKPAVKATGFELYRLDEQPRAGLIDDRLRVEIRTSRFLISDLTHENAGAYWEAGFAEGLGKPVIYTCEKSKFETQKTHFDTNHHLTIIWDKENPQDAANQLKATIRATLPEEAKLLDDQE